MRRSKNARRNPAHEVTDPSIVTADRRQLNAPDETARPRPPERPVTTELYVEGVITHSPRSRGDTRKGPEHEQRLHSEAACRDAVMCRRAQGGHHADLRASALEQGREYLERPVGPHARTGHENSFMTTERFCDELGSTAWAESTRAGVAAGVSSLELSHGGSAWLSMWEAGRAGALLRSPRGPEGTPAFSTGACAPESLVVKRRAGQPRVPVDQQARSADQARHRTKPGRQAPAEAVWRASASRPAVGSQCARGGTHAGPIPASGVTVTVAD